MQLLNLLCNARYCNRSSGIISKSNSHWNLGPWVNWSGTWGRDIYRAIEYNRFPIIIFILFSVGLILSFSSFSEEGGVGEDLKLEIVYKAWIDEACNYLRTRSHVHELFGLSILQSAANRVNKPILWLVLMTPISHFYFILLGRYHP